MYQTEDTTLFLLTFMPMLLSLSLCLLYLNVVSWWRDRQGRKNDPDYDKYKYTPYP